MYPSVRIIPDAPLLQHPAAWQYFGATPLISENIYNFYIVDSSSVKKFYNLLTNWK